MACERISPEYLCLLSFSFLPFEEKKSPHLNSVKAFVCKYPVRNQKYSQIHIKFFLNRIGLKEIVLYVKRRDGEVQGKKQSEWGGGSKPVLPVIFAVI